MDIRISKESDVPLREQLSVQLVFLIATRKLNPGDTLPNVRALARTLNIHHNTVSEAYQYLVEIDLLVRRRGSRLVVREPGQVINVSQGKDLDDLINDTVKLARNNGFTMQQLMQRVRERTLEEPPDHVLALSFDPGMRRLFEAELSRALKWPVESCSPDQPLAHPGAAIGALVVTAPGVLPTVVRVLPKTRPAIPIIYSDATRHLDVVRRLRQPSLIAVASISEGFLEVARGLLAPVTGSRHSLMAYLVPEGTVASAPPADVLFCDAIAYGLLRGRTQSRRMAPYLLISKKCLEQITDIMPALALAEMGTHRERTE